MLKAPSAYRTQSTRGVGSVGRGDQRTPVLLNRAPTLHRLGIQAFEPILIEGSAIQLHPLVTTAFNADFDGDQMAVHVPLSQKAVWEARQLMLSSRNLLKPADGEPIISPSKDMVLGVYYLTKTDKREHLGTGRIFSNMDEVEMAFQLGQVDIHADIKLLTPTWFDDNNSRLLQQEERLIDTTVGRVIFNRVLPPQMQFMNWVLDKGGLKDLMADLYEVCGEERTPEIADSIKDIGFITPPARAISRLSRIFLFRLIKQRLSTRLWRNRKRCKEIFDAVCSPTVNKTIVSSKSGNAPPTWWEMRLNATWIPMATWQRRLSLAQPRVALTNLSVGGYARLNGRPLRTYHSIAYPF
jgi:hypothetical protein